MPRNSSGIYTLPAGNPVVADTVIDVDWANPTMSDIGNEITLSLPRNGSAGMTGPLMLLGNATAPLEAVTLQQLTSMTAGYLPLTGGTLTGDLTLSGNGRRIKGDFSNANVADRLAFQTNVANGDTILAIIPNGTSAASRYDVYNGSDIANAGQFRFQATSGSMRIAAEKTGTGAYQPIEFLTSSLARLTIGVDGKISALPNGGTGPFLIGTSIAIGQGDNGSNYGFSYAGNGSLRSNYAAGNEGFQINASAYTSGTTYMMVFRAGTASARGFISFDGTNIAYTSSSDYRLKENVRPMVGGLDKILALKPCTFDWKEHGRAGEGFIAHELQAVIPAAVTGEKDAVDEAGEMVIQGVDQAKIVATLVAAVQELSAKVTSLEAQLASR